MDKYQDFKGVLPSFDEDLSIVPECSHGPTVIFQRFSKGKNSERKFFACSACRDRSLCSFFHWTDVPITEEKLQIWKEEAKQRLPQVTHDKFLERLKIIQQKKKSDRSFCVNCGLFVLKEDVDHHSNHRVITDIDSNQLAKPTQLLPALTKRKSNAQFFFADNTVEYLVNMIGKLGYKNVLCIGVPSVHQYIQRQLKINENGMNSVLMDIDHRFGQFYDKTEYCRYNMFNHFFFHEATGEALYKESISKDETVVLVDPPFGALPDLLFNTLKQINKDWKSASLKKRKGELPVFAFYPYFFEKQVVRANKQRKSFKTITMLDYKVNYINHKQFNEAGSNPKSSPIRMFTNIAVEKVKLPENEGYRLCKECQRYVSPENEHCFDCGSCTSKNGLTYKHCYMCEKCVKPTYIHCKACTKCVLKKHDCKKVKKNVCGRCNAVHPAKVPCSRKALKRKIAMLEGKNKKMKIK